MAFGYKILGQSAPANTSVADLYTVPANTQAIVSNIAVVNTTAVPAKYRIFIRSGSGVSSTAAVALAYDVSISGNDTVFIAGTVTLDAGSIITVRSDTANAITFHAFGSEVTA